MTNYNPKPNIERQLELPGMETAGIENIARQLGLSKIELEARTNTSPKSKTRRMGLVGKTILGLALLGTTLGGTFLGKTAYTHHQREPYIINQQEYSKAIDSKEIKSIQIKVKKIHQDYEYVFSLLNESEIKRFNNFKENYNYWINFKKKSENKENDSQKKEDITDLALKIFYGPIFIPLKALEDWEKENITKKIKSIDPNTYAKPLNLDIDYLNPSKENLLSLFLIKEAYNSANFYSK